MVFELKAAMQVLEENKQQESDVMFQIPSVFYLFLINLDMPAPGAAA